MSPVPGLDGAELLIVTLTVLPCASSAAPFPLKTVEANSPVDELYVNLDAAI